MADSKRLTILKALTTLLESITIANGYQHTLTGRVLRGHAVIGDRPLPLVSIIESFNPDREPDEAGGHQSRVQKDKWILLVQGWVDDDFDNPTDPAHLLLADVKKCLSRLINDDDAEYCLGGLIVNARIEPGVVRPPDENSAKAFFWLRLQLEVTERLDDPYSLD